MIPLPFLLILSLIAGCIELEISAPGFPQMMACFFINEATVCHTMTLNLLGFSLGSLVYGPLSDAYGRRPVMLLGNGLLVLGSMGCALAPTVSFLMASRMVQGLGAAASAVIVSAIIADVYDRGKASSLYAVMNAVFTSLMAVSPVVGGALVASLTWRAPYGLVAAIGLVAWMCLAGFLRETHKKPTSLDIKKVCGQYGTVLSSPPFLWAAVAPSLLYASYMAFMTLSAFLYRHVLSQSMAGYTFHLAFIVGIFCVTSLFCQKIMGFWGTKRVLIFGLVAQMAGTMALCLSQSAHGVTAAMSLFSLGFALIYPPIFAHSMEVFPHIRGVASSAIMALRYAICSGMVFLTSHAFNGSVIRLGGILLGASISVAILVAMVLRHRGDPGG